MAKTMKLLLRVGFTLFILTGMRVERVEAQNVFHVWFDTVTARAGDTVEMNVHYTFTSTHSHSIDSYQLRFMYDTSEVFPIYPYAFVLDSTASGLFFDTTFSHSGILAIGQSELDLTNPVLIRIRFRVNRQLADTAFIRWDTSSDLFDPSEGVDQVILQDGWIRTASVAGHMALSTPPVTVHGITDGYSPDSVAFKLPVSVSNIASANIRSALFSFAYDSARFPLNGVSADAASGIEVDSVNSSPIAEGSRQVNIWIHGLNGAIGGGDTLLRIAFTGLVGLDTICDTLGDVSLRPTNADGLIGNTVYPGNPICLEGVAPSAVEMPEELPANNLQIYPNPATVAVRMEAPDEAAPATITVFDMLGRTIGEWSGGEVLWQIPPGVVPGIYRVVCGQQQKMFMKTLVIER